VPGLGALTYLLLRNLAHWLPDAIGAVCGCVISAVLIVAMLFEGWPAAQRPAVAGGALTLALTAVVAVVLNRGLAAYADGVGWIRATPNDWITTAALSFIWAGIILHVGIGLRWPFARPPGPGRGESGGYAVSVLAAASRPSSLMDASRILNFCTLPVTVIGNSPVIRRYRGILKCAICPVQKARSSSSVSC
jgi:hypothetical protein